MGCHKSGSKMEVHSNTSLPQETKKYFQVNNLIPYIKELEEEQTSTKLVE